VSKVLIEEFPHAPGGHCGSTSMRDMLKFYGHEYTEDMVFGLGAGIDFMYISHPALEPPVYIGGRSPNLEENLCLRLGVGMEYIIGLDDDEAWRAVREMLDDGVPAMLHCDVYYLDYLNAKRHFSAHRIILVGYDDEKGVAFVADNDREEIQECSFDSLRKARASASLPRPAGNAYYRFEVPTRLTPLEEAVPPAIGEAVKHCIRLPEAEASFEHAGARVGLGETGLGAFVADMPSFPDSMTADMLTLLCKTIYVSAEKGGTGYGGNFRRMYGRFLKEASGVAGFGALDALGDDFISVGDIWTRMSLTFKENSSDGRKAVEAAHPMGVEIHEREVKAFEALDEASRRWRAR
jgi:hypothetical protein